jgi:hypothetical protein
MVDAIGDFKIYTAVKMGDKWELADNVIDYSESKDAMIVAIFDGIYETPPDGWIEVDSTEWSDLVTFGLNTPDSKLKREDIMHIVSMIEEQGGFVQYKL